MRARAILGGGAVALLSTLVCAALLAGACHILFPEFLDRYPPLAEKPSRTGDLIGVGVWTVAVFVGVVAGLRAYRSRCR
jgi:hypothetical protein